jgi:hypothetical protein
VLIVAVFLQGAPTAVAAWEYFWGVVGRTADILAGTSLAVFSVVVGVFAIGGAMGLVALGTTITTAITVALLLEYNDGTVTKIAADIVRLIETALNDFEKFRVDFKQFWTVDLPLHIESTWKSIEERYRELLYRDAKRREASGTPSKIPGTYTDYETPK